MIAGQPKPQPRVILVVASTASATIPIDLPDDIEVKVVPRIMFETYDDWKIPGRSVPKTTSPPKRQTLQDLGPKPNRQERRKRAALSRRSFRR